MKNEFIYPMRIHIEDTDFGGMVYHSNYLNFMERARSEWIDEMGMGITWQRQHRVFFLVHTVNIQFLKPARVHDKVEVVSTIKQIKRASMVFDQYLREIASPHTILCKAEIKIVCTDEKMHPCAIPEVNSLETIRRMLP